MLCAVSHIFVYWSAPSEGTSYLSASSVVSRASSALCVYSKFGHHPHPLGCLCAKFRICRGPHCWASPWRWIAYSITQSLNHPAYLMLWEPKLKLSLRNNAGSCKGQLLQTKLGLANTSCTSDQIRCQSHCSVQQVG